MDQASVVIDQEGEASSKEGSHTSIECPVCLQICVHPVRLPCKHVFCYLCVKGVANRSKCCAMCRREIPQDYLTNPALISEEQVQIEAEKCDGHQWYYEGWNGWWQYDARASMELEEKFNANRLQSFELLIAGFLYVIDFENMIQYRRNDPSRRRRIKRDLSNITKKGVAGLKINQKKSSQLGSTSNISNEVIPNIREVERAQAEGTEADNIVVTVQSNIPVQNIAAISNMSTTNNGRFCPPVSTRAYRRLNRHTNENIPRYTNTNRSQTSISTSDLAENLSALSLEPHRPEGSEFVSEQAPDGATNSDNLPRTIPAVPYTGYNSGSINGSASGSMSGLVPSRRRQNNAPPGDSTLDE